LQAGARCKPKYETTTNEPVEPVTIQRRFSNLLCLLCQTTEWGELLLAEWRELLLRGRLARMPYSPQLLLARTGIVIVKRHLGSPLEVTFPKEDKRR
jgi:hypothetical protein